jgi:hypothetical protein
VLKKLRRRPSPGTALAGLALFVALTGTAAAQGVPVPIITSPDQLASNVVTGPKIAQGAVSGTDIAQETITDLDLKDPQLKVRAISSGATLSGSDGTVVRTGIGSYRVTFFDTALNANGGGNVDNMLNNNCAFSAVSRNKTAIMSVDGPVAALPNSVIVRAAFPDPDGLLRAVDTQFDVLASC